MPKEIKHPKISQTLKIGFLSFKAQPEHAGIDYYGHGILLGDSIVMDPSTGEVVLKVNLDSYLSEVYVFYLKLLIKKELLDQTQKDNLFVFGRQHELSKRKDLIKSMK
ncbi:MULTISPECIES: hypothetical protein [unclassified Peribacillus]|uniref:hypothetical protein n=1 Tax=unclassified Peribacillus TaxID=2675266 RepID=UPI0019135804|nr:MULTISPECIES: hypothetical protein [unclassified Peribacillus]MBK5446196.1 hypothetical protein [Peribacillus sp. TH24]MBK5502500.1 hypothetical protein [Peribacillus sp. TH14]WMX57581.1 hypothetical protein RE409_10390 [Peribacillus sp. R9-11]